MTGSLAQKTRFELRGDLAATAAFPGRELDHGSPRNPPVREPRNRVVQVRCFGGPDGLEVVDAPLPRAERGEVRVRILDCFVAGATAPARSTLGAMRSRPPGTQQRRIR